MKESFSIRVPAIFPGSFNPLHEGHRRMQALAEQILGVPVCYELSITNVDKPQLDAVELEKRLAQFDQTPCWITQAPLFSQKAELFPQTTFVVGADTIVRIASPDYYQSVAEMGQAIESIKDSSCKFLVFGRLIMDQVHEIPQTLEDSNILALCRFVSESEFRMDLSSSELREQ